MKFAFKSLAVAAALVAAGVANAAVVTAVPGTTLEIKDDARGAASTGRTAAITITTATGSLYFSHGYGDSTITPAATQTAGPAGLIGALNVGKVAVTAIDGATKDEQSRTVGRFNTNTRAVVGVNATVTGLTADTATGAFSTVTTRGGATQTAYYLDGVLDGGIATVNNLSLDISDANNVKVPGNLVGTALINGAASAADAPEYGPQQTYSGVIWDQAKISGPTSLPPAELIAAADGDIAPLQARGYTLLGTDSVVVNGQTMTRYTVQANNLITNLQVTGAGFNAFASTLGLTEGGTGYNTLAGVNGTGGWGVMKAAITFQAYEVPPAIPEPSTYAMMLLGLAGIGLVARRRAAK